MLAGSLALMNIRKKMQRNNRSKPPYLLAILCLIPLIGAFVGLALIFYGISRYKDRLLVIIGSVGVLITIVVYSSLFLFYKYSKTSNDAFIQLSHITLDKTVQTIEFYKLTYGSYPDSLEQLKRLDETIMIADPILIKKASDEVNVDFHYEKIGTKFSIFSVGPDTIPHTSDDIYPSSLSSDTNLIKEVFPASRPNDDNHQ